MSYDDEDIYDRIQDARIEQAELADAPLPDPWPRTIEASLLASGDLIVLPAYVQYAGWYADVARVIPFQGGATVDVELRPSGRSEEVVLHDQPGVTVLMTAASRHEPYPRWTGAPA